MLLCFSIIFASSNIKLIKNLDIRHLKTLQVLTYVHK